MFENDLAELDAAGTLAAAEANEHTLTTAETRRLQLAAHWADLHPGDAVQVSRIPGTERPVRLGGDGTPTIGDFAPAELGCVLRISDGSASRLIGDALDLRHRLPLLWAAAQAGQVPAYQARHIAAATRHLTAEQAGLVDQRLAPALGAVPFGRLQTLLQAAILAADPDAAEQAAEAAARERFVRLGRGSEHGLKLIIARAAAGDAIWFKATIDRIADILAQEGDEDPVEVRRSKAIGILAQPAEALQLLCQHQDDPWHGPTDPDDLAAEPAQDQIDLGQTTAARWPEPVEGRDHALQTQDTAPIDDQHSPAISSAEGCHRSLHITPPPFDPTKARPRAVVYVHFSQEALCSGTGLARVEEVGPVLLSRLHSLLGDHCSISVKPVIDLPAGHIAVDSYEIPASLREHLQLRYPADVFPYAAAVSRKIDIDHTIAYLSLAEGGPPSQTRIGNLGPHTRYHHRLKTHGNWQVRQPEPGTWLWRSPHHRTYLINPTGTHPLGDTQFAETIWRTAESPVPAITN
ncbi:MAG TPA: DUF222 domain-containing protein [Propionibacteriaceae bacterium]|nr:DUF222 domain-containing protein [Propionibacteriaceae bacterium]